jgi:IS6 family transposase
LRIEADRGQRKHRYDRCAGLRTEQTAHVIISGHGFVQNLRRGHYELGLDAPSGSQVAAAFTELVHSI